MKKKIYNILSLSGGKDSSALAFFIKNNMPELHKNIEYVLLIQNMKSRKHTTI